VQRRYRRVDVGHLPASTPPRCINLDTFTASVGLPGWRACCVRHLYCDTPGLRFGISRRARKTVVTFSALQAGHATRRLPPSRTPQFFWSIKVFLGGSVAEGLACWTQAQKGPGCKSQPRRCRVTVLGKLFTPIVPLFTKQRNW